MNSDMNDNCITPDGFANLKLTLSDSNLNIISYVDHLHGLINGEECKNSSYSPTTRTDLLSVCSNYAQNKYICERVLKRFASKDGVTRYDCRKRFYCSILAANTEVTIITLLDLLNKNR